MSELRHVDKDDRGVNVNSKEVHSSRSGDGRVVVLIPERGGLALAIPVPVGRTTDGIGSDRPLIATGADPSSIDHHHGRKRLEDEDPIIRAGLGATPGRCLPIPGLIPSLPPLSLAC